MPVETNSSDAGEGRSEAKRRAIREAAQALFLTQGYAGVSMDEVAARAQVSKQTIYKHFSTKEQLFIEIVTAMTDAASADVHQGVGLPGPDDAPEAYLVAYARRQLERVLQPELMQLRRLVIGEVSRFPELAAALRSHGPQHAMATLAGMLARFGELGALEIGDASEASADFNWLVMSGPLNDAMLLGDAGIPSRDALRRHAQRTVAVFLRAYASHSAGLRGGR